MSKICPNCGFSNERDYIYCRECGSVLPPAEEIQKPIENIIICPNCKQENPPVASICSNCGTQLISARTKTDSSSYVSDVPIVDSDLGFQWYYIFTYPFYWIGRVFRFCFGNCCCFCCCDDPTGCDASGCDCGGSSTNGGCDCCSGADGDCGACGDCGGCDGGGDCGGCDCGGCDCGGCDISC